MRVFLVFIVLVIFSPSFSESWLFKSGEPVGWTKATCNVVSDPTAWDCYNKRGCNNDMTISIRSASRCDECFGSPECGDLINEQKEGGCCQDVPDGWCCNTIFDQCNVTVTEESDRMCRKKCCDDKICDGNGQVGCFDECIAPFLIEECNYECDSKLYSQRCNVVQEACFEMKVHIESIKPRNITSNFIVTCEPDDYECFYQKVDYWESSNRTDCWYGLDYTGGRDYIWRLDDPCDDNFDCDDGLSTGGIIGICVGGGVFVILLILFAFMLYRCRQSKKNGRSFRLFGCCRRSGDVASGYKQNP